jgi:multisubunit Na+/H+ antiporter MnhE subunit
MTRILAALLLPLRFAWAVVTSGVQTVALILRHGLRIGEPVPSGFVRIEFAPMSAQGAALLGCMITLTPGTTVIDIDMASRQMVMHMMDTRDPEAAVAAIRRDFEPGLVALFGEANR